MDVEEFRRHGHAIVDWIADYHQRLPSLPVQARTAPGEVKGALPAGPPQHGEPFEDCIADLDRLVVPHLSHWQHPSFFGYFPGNAMPAGILGDFVSTGLGVLGLSRQSSPALSEIEEVVVDWFRQMVGLSTGWSGVINDTASTSTLVALLCARERSTDFSLARGGFQAEAAPHIVYASAGSHSSVEKGALLAGYGREHVRLVPLDSDQGMRADAFAAMVQQDLDRGLIPSAVVACVGGTTSGSLDPIDAIGTIAQQHGMWFHVDAAMAGAAMILPEKRWMWDGVERADSLVINAHKWLGVPFDCSLSYVRNEQHLNRVMSTNPSYLQSSVDSEVRNLRDTGIPLGRRFRALKLWFLIREQGVKGLQARLRRDMENTDRLAKLIAKAPDWHVLAPAHIQTLCIRHEPEAMLPDEIDNYTRAWADAVNRSGDAYVTPAILDDRWMVRISIGAPTTEWGDVERLWETILQHSGRLLEEQSARS